MGQRRGHGAAGKTGGELLVPLDFLTEIANTATLDELFQAIATRLPEIFPADRISIALRHSETTLSVVAVTGHSIRYDMKPIPIDGTKPGECFTTRRSIVVNDADRDGEKYARAVTPGQDRYRSSAILPLIVGDECLGTLNFGCQEPNSFSPESVDDLGKIATWIALQISRYKAIERLQASEGRFNALIDHADALIFAKTAEGRILVANDKYCEYVRRDRAEIVGKLEAEIFPTAIIERWQKQDREILATMNRATFDSVMRDPDGVRRTFITQKFPVFDPVLKEHIICGISTDLTDKKYTERALAESEERSRAFFTNLPQMMYIKDADSRLVYVNPAYLAFYGQTEDSALGKTSAGHIGPDRLAELESVDRDVFRNGAVRKLEFQLPDGDGELHDFLITKFPIRDADGDIIGIGGINNDISELRGREKELLIAHEKAERAAEMFRDAADKAKAADIAKSDFLASMSHELRTPLNGVMGMANLLLDSGLDADQEHKVNTIHTSGQALLTLLNDILDLSKIEAGELEIENHDFSLPALVSGIEDLWKSQAEAKSLDWVCRVDTPVSAVLNGDSAKIRQVVFNLLSNAIKFTEHGRIAFSISQSEAADGIIETLFEIADTGPGIDSGARKKLFDKFTQANSSIARKYGGTGLGLAICRSLVELMDGEISYESDTGAGTVFRFTVNCRAGAADYVSPGVGRQNVAPQTGGAPLHVLVAEDNDVNQQVIRLMLLRAGHDCNIVNNGHEAVAAVQARPYDLVIMDIQMPEMDGITATGKIRGLGSASADIPIIALTANAMKGDHEAYFAAGMNDYVPKPIDPAALSAAIARQTGRVTDARPDASAAPSPEPDAIPGAGADPALGAEVDALFAGLDPADDA